LRKLQDIERILLHRAAYVSTPSHVLAEALHARHGGRPPIVIGNSFPLQPTPRAGPPGTPPAFFWFSQTLGPGRGLELFLAAWRCTQCPSRLVLLGEDRSDFAARLLASLPDSHRERVTFLSLVPPHDLPAVIAQHDIGLALEQPFIVNRDLTITNKILQYLNAGLAVVASTTAGQREVLQQGPAAGIQVELGETTRLAEQLDRLLADRDGLAARQGAARELAERVYCWEQEAPRLVAAVNSALAP
jgi:glycosyltransferase involved in cell wall biosynthesis